MTAEGQRLLPKVKICKKPKFPMQWEEGRGDGEGGGADDLLLFLIPNLLKSQIPITVGLGEVGEDQFFDAEYKLAKIPKSHYSGDWGMCGASDDQFPTSVPDSKFANIPKLHYGGG